MRRYIERIFDLESCSTFLLLVFRPEYIGKIIGFDLVLWELYVNDTFDRNAWENAIVRLNTDMRKLVQLIENISITFDRRYQTRWLIDQMTPKQRRRLEHQLINYR